MTIKIIKISKREFEKVTEELIKEGRSSDPQAVLLRIEEKRRR